MQDAHCWHTARVTARAATWAEVADRLGAARNYWLGTCDPDGAPHAVPVWGALVTDDLYLYSARATVKARHMAANPEVVVHLESAEDVVIVNGAVEDVGLPQAHADVLAALEAKYTAPEDVGYLPSTDASFDVMWRLRPHRAMLWRLDDYEASQARWAAP